MISLTLYTGSARTGLQARAGATGRADGPTLEMPLFWQDSGRGMKQPERGHASSACLTPSPKLSLPLCLPPSLPFPPCTAFLIHTPQPGCDQAEPLPFLPCPRHLASPHDPSSHAHSSLAGLPLPPYLKCQSDPSPTPPNRLIEYLLCALRTQYWN